MTTASRIVEALLSEMSMDDLLFKASDHYWYFKTMKNGKDFFYGPFGSEDDFNYYDERSSICCGSIYDMDTTMKLPPPKNPTK